MSSLYVAARVAFDGTDYCGYQYQNGVPTIQGELEQALRAFSSFDGRVIGSGRTDTGVHAVGQVIAAEVPWSHGPAVLQQAWNAHLPDAIQVRNVVEAPGGFHPRFSATARTYRYTVDCYSTQEASVTLPLPLPRHSPLTERFALFEPRFLDLMAMDSAASLLLGEHDFATFGQPPQGENTVRQVYEAGWQAVESNLRPLADLPGRRFVFTICASAFLRRMVRNLVGTLLEVGRGRRRSEDVQAALMARDRRRSAPPAPPAGLTLERVDYPVEICPWSDCE